MSNLAILGGTPVIDAPLAPYNRIGEEEVAAVINVVRNGELSGFVGAPGPEFDGGTMVRSLEERWSSLFGVTHSVSVNSATSGLFAAIGAAGIGPGDEVIVPPYTMSATAMAPLVYGADAVFVDIEPETFCLDPEKVQEAITDRTRAIIAVNLFGHPAQLAELRAIADRHDCVLIEDNAQAPLAVEHGRYTGTVGHIGVFSLNRHKHIQTGEGGICVTDDEALALRLRLIRNHGENLADHYGIADHANLIGFNYRLTELSAAVGLCQLEKSAAIIDERERYAQRLTNSLSDLPGLVTPAVREGCRHTYYVWPARFDAETAGTSRDAFARALTAEGVPVNQGYVAPLYSLPVFRKRAADGDDRYREGRCPVTERMHFEEELGFGICSFELSDRLIDQIADAFRKVYENLADLQRIDAETTGR